MGRTLFDDLDDEWSRLCASRAGKRAVARWGLGDAGELGTLDAVHDEISRGQESASSNALFRQVIAEARNDEIATRLALQCMMPAMRATAKRWWTTDGWLDVQSTVITETLDRISRYPLERRMGWVAANIARDVNQTFSRRVGRQPIVDLHDVPPVPPVIADSPRDELLDLVAEGSRWGAIDKASAELIVRTRLLDDTPAHLSQRYGIKPQSLRRRRQRAEERLEAFVNG